MSEEKLCKVCKSPFSGVYTFREMMFGTRDEFIYFECSSCGCLQIDKIPVDIEKYYPPYYYSFNTQTPVLKRQSSGLLGIIKQFFINKNERRLRKQALSYLDTISIKPHHKILDVGCGKGELICRLFNLGYENVRGTDKYLAEEINYDFGVRIIQKDLKEIQSNSYDLVMMNHVFEHMFFPLEELKECYRILKKKSFLMVRIPIKGTAWSKYKNDWVQLDAPRHFFIHTLQSITILAEQAGFKIHRKVFDSLAFQFVGSEFYKRDIPLHDPVTHQPYPAKKILSKQERKFFRQEAKRLNENETGDQAIFYLFKD